MSEATIEYDWSEEALADADDVFERATEGGAVEIAICVDCGVWDRWDSDLAKYGHCVGGKPHRASRVQLILKRRSGTRIPMTDQPAEETR